MAACSSAEEQQNLEQASMNEAGQKRLEDEIFQSSTWKRRAIQLEVEIHSVRRELGKERELRVKYEEQIRDLTTIKVEMEGLKAQVEVQA
jgi:hypothetical protein